jgi:hypothetical protein
VWRNPGAVDGRRRAAAASATLRPCAHS